MDLRRRNRLQTLRALCISLLSLVVVACSEPQPETSTPEPATLVVRNATVWTGNPEQAWASAVAARGEEIIAVGSNEEINRFVGANTRIVEARNSMLVPGFIDAHVHFLDGGSTIASVQLRDAQSPDEFTQRVADFASSLPENEWITGGTWDHTNWGGELPQRAWIDAATPDNPVWVVRLDGHMGVANSLALKMAGVDAETPDVGGGEIVRDADGRPTGVLKDNAMGLVLNAIPQPTDRQLDDYLHAAMHYVASNGVTSVHDMFDVTFDSWRSLDVFRRAEADGRLITRIYSVMALPDWQRLVDDIAEHGRGSEWLRTGGVKGLFDGSLGSHTAAFLEPYSDTPHASGFLLYTLKEFRDWISDADAAGLQLNVHAIGDKAIRDLLDIYFDVAKENGPKDRRFRLEHAQHIHPEDVQRFALQDVIASMQPYHAIDDGRWAADVIGAQRAQTTYAFKSLIDSGAHVAFGSDWYVAPATPLEGIYAAVTRRTLDDANPDGWIPQEKITVEQALRAYTVEGAYASFEENRKGALKPGMLADMVLIDRNLTEIPPEEIRDAQVVVTIVGGRVVFQR